MKTSSTPSGKRRTPSRHTHDTTIRLGTVNLIAMRRPRQAEWATTSGGTEMRIRLATFVTMDGALALLATKGSIMGHTTTESMMAMIQP